MGNKVIVGQGVGESDVSATPPVGDAGMDMNEIRGISKPDKWLVVVEVSNSTALATLDLDTVSTDLDTIVQAVPLGGLGNGVSVRGVNRAADGGGVQITETAMLVTISWEQGVSTVAQVEAAITADATLVTVGTPGTAATVLGSNDAFVATHLAGGTDAANTSDVIVYGRDAILGGWGLYNDMYGTVKSGVMLDGVGLGRHHFVIRDLGLFDRVAFRRATGETDGQVDVKMYAISNAGRGS